jgi:hypothetical protein
MNVVPGPTWWVKLWSPAGICIVATDVVRLFTNGLPKKCWKGQRTLSNRLCQELFSSLARYRTHCQTGIGMKHESFRLELYVYSGLIFALFRDKCRNCFFYQVHNNKNQPQAGFCYCSSGATSLTAYRGLYRESPLAQYLHN